jgi:hypothetical protein
LRELVRDGPDLLDRHIILGTHPAELRRLALW